MNLLNILSVHLFCCADESEADDSDRDTDYLQPTQPAEESSDSDMDITLKKRFHNETVRKTRWPNDIVDKIQTYFKDDLYGNYYPSGDEMKEFLRRNAIKKTVPQLRSQIQHLKYLKKSPSAENFQSKG